MINDNQENEQSKIRSIRQINVYTFDLHYYWGI